MDAALPNTRKIPGTHVRTIDVPAFELFDRQQTTRDVEPTQELYWNGTTLIHILL
jgi:hypothetical protein